MRLEIDGEWKTGNATLQAHTLPPFGWLYSQHIRLEPPSTCSLPALTIISEVDHLTVEVSIEVSLVVKELKGFSAPGPDEIPVMFYKIY